MGFRPVGAVSLALICIIPAAYGNDSNTPNTNVGDTAPSGAGLAAPSVNSSHRSAAADENSGSVLEEITVLAQKRAENLQNVPISVTALSAETLAQSGVEDTLELQTLTPALQFTHVLGAGQPFLRGIGSYNTTVGDENPTAVYVDGVYIPSMESSLFSLNNIARVEVLRGPQGTLYGRNAAAGVIQIVTRDPQHETAGDASVSYGSFNRWRGTFYGTTGISDRIAADVAVVEDHQDGWGTNAFAGKDAFYNSNFGIRSKWLYDFENTRVTFAADYNRAVVDYGDRQVAAPGFNAADGTTFQGPFTTFANRAAPDETKQYGASLKIEQRMPWATFASISSWRRSNGNDGLDQDGGPLPFGDADIFFDNKDFTQEFQLLSPDKSKVTWVVGAYYFHWNAKYDPLRDSIGEVNLTTPVPIPALGQTIAAPFGIFPLSPPFVLDVFTQEITASYAAFAQAKVEVLSATHLTVGARYTKDDRKVEGFVVGSPFTTNETRVGKATYRVTLDHDFTSDIMGYVQYSTGFKSGVYNLVNPYQAVLKPETIRAAELGVKAEALEHRVRFNASAFHYSLKDVQINHIVLGSTELFNAASAKVYGGEAEMDALPTQHLTLRASIAYLHARFDSFPGAPLFYPNPVPNPAGGSAGYANYSGDASGYIMPNAPKWMTNVGGNYTVPTKVGAFAAAVNVSYTAREYQLDNQFTTPGYTLTNASLGWTAPSDRWNVSLIATNLFNRRYLLTREAGFVAFSVGESYGDPRLFELRFGSRW